MSLDSPQSTDHSASYNVVSGVDGASSFLCLCHTSKADFACFSKQPDCVQYSTRRQCSYCKTQKKCIITSIQLIKAHTLIYNIWSKLIEHTFKAKCKVGLKSECLWLNSKVWKLRQAAKVSADTVFSPFHPKSEAVGGKEGRKEGEWVL